MAVNADKPRLWKADIAASVDQFNAWFMEAAPKAFRETRIKTTSSVLEALSFTRDHLAIRPETLKVFPAALPTLRMSTCPPIAVDRLVGLAGVAKNIVLAMDRDGKVPPRMLAPALEQDLAKICRVISALVDPDLFPWVSAKRKPTKDERARAATVVADRLCGALSNPIVRNAQEKRQLALIGQYLKKRGYKQKPLTPGRPFTEMEPGTYMFRVALIVGDERKVNIPIDVVIQPREPRRDRFPILIEAKSAGDFTNTNKRRKEEATKIRQLRDTYGSNTQLILFLCGYFDGGYLGYEAAEGIDWVWEHRISDLDHLGI
jgi:hypothetical protein